jgi:putative transposase
MDDTDRRRFLKCLGESVEEDGIRLYLFCLMPNHFHLLAETPRGNLSRFMHRLQTAYTVYFNQRHERAGHLMQGRFGVVPVQGDHHLLKLSRYVHLNPVATSEGARLPMRQRTERLRTYPWSSYRGYAGLDEPWDFVDERPILAMIRGAKPRLRAEYRRFVELGLAKGAGEWEELFQGARWGIGDGEYQERVRNAHQSQIRKMTRREDASFRLVRPARAPEQVLKAVATEYGSSVAALQTRTYAGTARSVAVLLLTRHAGLTQRAAADLLNMGTGAAACLQLSRLKKRMKDPEGADLAARVAKLAQALSTPRPDC